MTRTVLRNLLNIVPVTVILPGPARAEREGIGGFRGEGTSEGRLTEAGEVLVATTTGDQLLERLHQPPDFVKLNVEGAELSVLRGATRMLEECRPTLAVEFHGAGLREDPPRDLDGECRRLLSMFGYRTVPVPRAAGWQVFSPLIAGRSGGAAHRPVSRRAGVGA